MLKKYLRQTSLTVYLILPYLALFSVGQNNAPGSWKYYLSGWMVTFIFQIFFIAVNQSKTNQHMPLYREAAALILPLAVLLKQLLFDGNIWLFLIEWMALEVVVLNVGVVVAMLFKAKDDWYMALIGSLFIGGSLLLTVLGLFANWLEMTQNRSWMSLLPLAFGFVSGCLVHFKFLLLLANDKIVLKDADFKNPVLFFVGQIVLWFGLMVWLLN